MTHTPFHSLDAALLDRATGALLGLAVGDALGTTLEFTDRDEAPHHTEMTGGGPFNLRPGQWTDDTSMALVLAESLIRCGTLDPRDLMDGFVRWWRTGAHSCTGTCFDIGMTTAAALADFERIGDPLAGPTAEDTAGNGSLMRVAPVALFALQDPLAASRLARLQSRTTHGAPQAVESCDLFVALLSAAILGADRGTLLAPSVWSGHPAVAAVAAGSWQGKRRGAIRASGYVIHTIEAALWAIAQTHTFEDALILAVNLGEDADTVGAVTGQLAGALYGYAAIPSRWLEPLAWRDRLTALAPSLITAGARAGAGAGMRGGIDAS
ncbi:ADP-ribosylglycohydrolase family protein [Roseomonas haemaphysalidis]|uniref:ADP-ribosylglycohydrolase family protein n=1 Tax=Roseomonas haemaphysalidis TaxID=2768162 RepID=A0ABS3KW13_9PROT|nr:ADP-ribosylglycohydrolase family protein [Roseomonas haemaphysalidis]MBO1081673.1 ADP-ribosylglycohydrolase family protein [Roseomonas haemaphysalidis]